MISKKRSCKKFALIHIGTDEVYGLEFVAAELKRLGHRIQWFDGDLEAAVEEVVDWQADFLCLSPLTTFLQPAVDFSRNVKSRRHEIQSIFGGHHVTAVPETCEMDGIDKGDFRENCSVLTRVHMKDSVDNNQLIKATNNQNPMQVKSKI